MHMREEVRDLELYTYTLKTMFIFLINVNMLMVSERL